jgi:hypothetical protein
MVRHKVRQVRQGARTMQIEDLPTDLPRVVEPVLWRDRASPPVLDEPGRVGDGWWGYEDGAAYNPRFDWTARDH